MSGTHAPRAPSAPIRAISYEGNGTGGWFTINGAHLSLNHIINPKITLSIGSTKDNQFAVASGGQVYALGPLTQTGENGGDWVFEQGLHKWAKE